MANGTHKRESVVYRNTDSGAQANALPAKEEGSSFIAQASAVAFYCAVGPALIFLNKHLLSTTGFKYPAFLSGLGVVFSSVISYLLIKVLGVVEQEHAEDISTRFYMTRVMPIGFSLAGTLAAGNLVYLYLSVSFIQMMKAFAPVILLTMLFVTRLEKPNLLLIISIVIIVSGTFASVVGEVGFSWFGLFIMFMSEFFESTKLVCMQILLRNFKFSVIEGLYFMAPAAVFWLGLFSLATEDVGDAMSKLMQSPKLFVLAGFLGFGVNLGGFLVVKTCSALTLRVLGLFRNIGIVFASAIFLGDVVSNSQFAGYLVSVSGMLLYQHSRKHPELTDEVVIKSIRRFVGFAKGKDDSKDLSRLLPGV